jgi:hypothetical protein
MLRSCRSSVALTAGCRRTTSTAGRMPDGAEPEARRSVEQGTGRAEVHDRHEVEDAGVDALARVEVGHGQPEVVDPGDGGHQPLLPTAAAARAAVEGGHVDARESRGPRRRCARGSGTGHRGSIGAPNAAAIHII